MRTKPVLLKGNWDNFSAGKLSLEQKEWTLSFPEPYADPALPILHSFTAFHVILEDNLAFCC